MHIFFIFYILFQLSLSFSPSPSLSLTIYLSLSLSLSLSLLFSVFLVFLTFHYFIIINLSLCLSYYLTLYLTRSPIFFIIPQLRFNITLHVYRDGRHSRSLASVNLINLSVSAIVNNSWRFQGKNASKEKIDIDQVIFLLSKLYFDLKHTSFMVTLFV